VELYRAASAQFLQAVETAARNQTWVDQARIACALERCRLANGKYPDTLAALVPQFLDKIPRDIINGKPMSFARTDEQNFKLYSIGWNEWMTAASPHTGDGKEDRDYGDCSGNIRHNKTSEQFSAQSRSPCIPASPPRLARTTCRCHRRVGALLDQNERAGQPLVA